jgi:hypothetical protein
MMGSQNGSVQLLASLGKKSVTNSMATVGSNIIEPGCVAPAILTGAAASMAYVSATEAIITFATNHGSTGAEVLAAFWTANGVKCVAYEGAITDYSAAKILHVTFGAGDSVPTPGPTTVNVAIGQSVTDGVEIVGANVQELIADTNQANGFVDLLASDVSKLGVAIGPSNTTPPPYVYPQSAGQAAIWSGTVDEIMFYNNSLAAATMTVTVSVT